MNELQIFKNDLFEIRTALSENGDPLFVAADVCRALDIKNPSQIADRLDQDEVAMLDIGLKNGVTVNVINESGLYNVILRSDKAEAKPFRLLTDGMRIR